ncbi:MAG: hypothetical protein U9Q81_03945 [Pseudomonadota bacterium]|nr:hypothetical protein [Pseudomonadota bacterium]
MTFPVFAAAILATLGGCSSSPPKETVEAAPTYKVSPATWRMVDEHIWAASEAAGAVAEAFAKEAMHDWMRRVRERSEENFIPWYTSYSTQQWLALKVGWYKLNESEGTASPAEQLSEYLQEQYYAQVLEPAGTETTDPTMLMDQAASMYVQVLGTELRDFSASYNVPAEAFKRRLDRIPAISLSEAPEGKASLYRAISAHDLTRLPAYKALVRQIQTAQNGSRSALSKDSLHEVAGAAADKLVGKLAVRGGTSAAALAAGGLPGILIAVGVSGWQAIEHEKDKPAMEAQLRANLSSALDEMRRKLMEDPHRGVMGAVTHMKLQIENGLLSAQIESEQPDRRLPDVF